MLKMLIIDDELNICKLIMKLVDWDMLELECAGVAHDGQEALRLAQISEPDLVLTDIRMPNDSGLEFIQKYSKISPQTLFIIISGYHSFEYAKQAIKLGVFDFLTKPLNQEDLNNTLFRACHTVIKNREDQKALDHFEKIAERFHYISSNVRKEFLTNLTHGTEIRFQTIDEINHAYNFQFQKGYFQFGNICLDTDTPNENYSSTLFARVERFFRENLAAYCCESESLFTRKQFIFLLNYSFENKKKIFTQFREILMATRDFIAQNSSFYVTLNLGKAYTDVVCLSNSWRESQICQNGRVVLGVNRIIYYPKHFSEQRVSLPEFPQTISFWQNIRKSVELQNREQTILFCQELTANMNSFFQEHPDTAYIWYETCLKNLCAIFKEMHFPENVSGNSNPDFTDLLYNCYHISQMNQFLLDYITQVFDVYEQSIQNTDSKMIQVVKAYIHEHYMEKLELEDTAGQVYLSPSYLGILFKQQTGQNYTDYVTDVRIEKAKEFLRNVDLSITEVAFAVGYKDVRYFSKTFKKKVGITPKEYRKISHL